MSGQGRDDSPFSGRVWQEIDRTVASVRAANCTARRFLEIDGPYGIGLTSTAGEEGWLPPDERGADFQSWNVRRPEPPRKLDADPSHAGGGTYLVSAPSRRVPLIASDFVVGMRAIEAYESGCQPLDLSRATRAARDLALEEERLLYYGWQDDPVALLRIVAIPHAAGQENATDIPVDPDPEDDDAVNRHLQTVLLRLHEAIAQLAARGFAGPFALTLEPRLYLQIYQPNAIRDTLFVQLLSRLFGGGIYMAPVIDPARDPRGVRGAIVTTGCAYSSLVIGQDWVTTYRGRDGVLFRFLLMSSLQLRISDPYSIQVLRTGNKSTAGKKG